MNILKSSLFFELGKSSSINQNDCLVLAYNEEEALSYYEHLKFFSVNKDLEILFLPSFDNLPYDRLSPSQRIMSERSYALSRLAIQAKCKILITSVANISLKYTNKSQFKESYLLVSKNDKISSNGLETFLLNNSYSRSSSAIEPGEYSRRGDILDLVLFSSIAYRINFGWDKIESIKEYDPESQISKEQVASIEIFPASELFFNKESIDLYKSQFLTKFGISNASDPYFNNISAGIRIAGIESLAPLFYDKPESLLSYLSSPIIYTTKLLDESLNEFCNDYEDFYQARVNSNKSGGSFYPAFEPDKLIFNIASVKEVISDSINIENDTLDYNSRDFYYLSKLPNAQNTPIDLFREYALKNLNKIILLAAKNVSTQERLKTLLSLNNIGFNEIDNFAAAKLKIINLIVLKKPFGFENDNVILITEKEIIGEKKGTSQSGRKKLKNIFKELENFSEGDLVVHIEHGLGRFETIEQLEVNGIKHDCLRIIYAKGDKLFIPVENISLVKRYGEGEAELDHLGSVSWQKRKAKLKERVGELAKSLIEIAAKRHVKSIEPILFNSESYSSFCSKFPYTETEDQLKAAEDIIEDLKSDKPMDRLICGDVGFGKTEIAMRAAYLVASDEFYRKQVAIVVPTTILARQHYTNFVERFSSFNIKIGQISRFTSSIQNAKTKQLLKDGELDIIVGTHSLLANDISFKKLGLLIVDEEQHFGVTQKEKLKQLKENIHTLTLSATPIPRTLQMSLMGIKELSLIATPPIDRLSVRTNLIPFDEVIIRDALLREKFRGGKSFFVCPRVSDLNEIFIKLQEIVPELSVKIAHGQLAASTIDEIMTEFYEGKFDILLSTAIVESGLDIPSANTMFIFKAEHFGLSQLYQLRGRVGRGKVRGYTYLVTNFKKLPTKSSIKRLEIIQNIDSLGAGFSIASHDMDIRGFGNLLGDEQSGHIKEVGIELYQEMLEEEILKLKNEKVESSEMPEINVSVPVYIPDEYIDDESLRLSIYRRIGDIKEIEELENFNDELNDRFGKIPDTVHNLLKIIELKIKAKSCHIKSIDVGSGGFNIKFANEVDHEKIMKYISKYPRNTKLKPDNKLTVIKNVDLKEVLKEVFLMISEFEI